MANEIVGAFGGAMQQAAGMALLAERIKSIASELKGNASELKGNPTADAIVLTKTFITDLLIQASLAEAPEIPSPYFAPLLFCTEKDSVFGKNATTNGVVAFSFQDIGNLFIEDSSMPRAIPVQQVPDSNEDNVQDMGRSSGYIKISGRVFGQAGLSRFEMLRNLCNYKGKKGLVFIDKNIGKLRVYPANIPGFTTSAEFFNQYAFQITFIVVAETNKQSESHRRTINIIKNVLAIANAAEALRVQLFRSLDAFKRLAHTLTPKQLRNDLRAILSQFQQIIPDEKIEAIIDVIQDGFKLSEDNNSEYPTFNLKEPRQSIYLQSVVPSKVMENGYTDGIEKEFWLPKREVGEGFDVFYKKVYNQLTEDDIKPNSQGDIEADKGSLIEGSVWKKMNLNSDYTIIDLVQRPNYSGEWTKIIFNTPPAKWGIVKVNYFVSKDLEYELINGDAVLFGEGLMYIDKIKGAIGESLIGKNVVPYPISGSSLNVIENDGVTDLYIPELYDDVEILKNVVIKKRTGSILNSKMEKITGFDVIPSTNWGDSKIKWGKIVLQEELKMGDFVSVDVVFKNELTTYNGSHPDYTILDDSKEIEFKWLKRPQIRVMGNIVSNLVLSPDSPDRFGLYHSNFLTDNYTKIYWVKGGIDTNGSIKIKLSDGYGVLHDISPDQYSIEGISARTGFSGIWGKIVFNIAPIENRVLVIDCRLRETLSFYKGMFSNSNFIYNNIDVSLLWMELIEDPYVDSTYRNIYPIPEGYNTGRNGFIVADEISEFWIPNIMLNELYPLKIKVNRSVVSNFKVEMNIDKIFGTTIQKWTKIIFYSPLKKGMLITADFTALEERTIYEQNYLEEISKDFYTDDCEPFKNKLGTKEYYTPFAIDTSKPIEVKIDGVIVPKNQYSVYKAVNRVYENKDGATISELMGMVKFSILPGDNTDIRIRYNRLDTPIEENFIVSKYNAEDDEKFKKIKEYYLINRLKPIEEKIVIGNKKFHETIKRIYTYPVDGSTFVTYSKSTNGSEFYYVRYDGIGEKYITKIKRYSFELKNRVSYNAFNVSKFNGQNTPMSLDLSVPKQGQEDWMDRYNSLVAMYPDPTTQQEREIASMLLGKLVNKADYSDDTQITDTDIANAKLWLQVYNSYLDSGDYVEAQKMLDDRTTLLQLGVDNILKEQDAINNITIPGESPFPVDLPPIEGWIMQETSSTIKYKKDSIIINLLDLNENIGITLNTKYRSAMKDGLILNIRKNQYGMIYYDASKKLRIGITCGINYEEYQFNIVKDLVDALKNGQVLNTNGGEVQFKKSEIITDPQIVEENAVLRTFNDTHFTVETFEIDKMTYETFLLAVYGDVDAITKGRRYNYSKYIKFQEIIGKKEASISLDKGLKFYKFSKLKSVGEN